jgi:hypothetical protein
MTERLSRDANDALRRAALMVDSALAAQASARLRAQATGVDGGAIAVASRPGGAVQPRLRRPRGANQRDRGDIDARTYRELLTRLREATQDVARARAAQRAAVRDAARLGGDLDLISAQARLPLAEVKRVVQRVPIT